MLDADEFEGLRRYLFSIAYRMVGSATEAEDLVQDAYLRAREAPRGEIQSLKAYLATVITRLSLDHLRSARARREVYVGPWLPEPVPTADISAQPDTAAERADDISLAALVLLERLTPDERATYVLREAFAFPFDEIGAMLGKSSAAVRQISHRAKERVAAGGSRFTATPDEQRRLAERFLAASRAGDMSALTAVLAENVSGWNDGGAQHLAARRPIVGRENVARFTLAGMQRWYSDVTMTFAEINGGAGVLIWQGPRLFTVFTLVVGDGQIQQFHTVLNPDKLAYLDRRLREMGYPIPAEVPSSQPFSEVSN